MAKININVVIFSIEGNSSLVITALKQAVGHDIKLNCSVTDNINHSGYDLAIACIHNSNSKILEKILTHRDNLNDNLIFVFESKDLLLGTVVAKLGFNNLFLFPDELFKFTTFISEEVENMADEEIQDYDSFSIETLIGKNPDSGDKIAKAKKAAENPEINLLIFGESGTGKGLLANAIHKYDTKKTGPFVEVTCTAIPDTLLESELFGYEKGAFTDAKAKKAGLFELAEGGTIFLDEIGDLELGLQAKLLKVIDKKSFRRLGGTFDIPLKVRIISATNKDLKKMVNQKQFRLDLFYRLSVLTIKLDPLRERKSEIMMMTKHLISKFSAQYNKSIKKVDRNVYEYIKQYNWPGNLREFRNAIDMSILMMEDKNLKLDYFKNFIQNLPQNENNDDDAESGKTKINFEIDYNHTDLALLTKQYANLVLEACNHNKSKTAKLLKISRPKLDSLLK